jgi:hypothetical protein
MNWSAIVCLRCKLEIQNPNENIYLYKLLNNFLLEIDGIYQKTDNDKIIKMVEAANDVYEELLDQNVHNQK